MTDWSGLPLMELGFPGALRDKLVAAVLAGAKTSTTGLVVDYDVCGEDLPLVGGRTVLIDSDAQPVAVLETTAVRVVRLADVDLQHALDEGEGDESVEQWRAGHEGFWSSQEMLDALADQGFRVDDDTMTVLQRFVVVER